MTDKSIKEQYQDKAQEVLERRPKDKTLSDKEIIENAMNCSTSKITCLRRVIVLMKDREKDFIQKLKEEVEKEDVGEEVIIEAKDINLKD